MYHHAWHTCNLTIEFFTDIHRTCGRTPSLKQTKQATTQFTIFLTVLISLKGFCLKYLLSVCVVFSSNVSAPLLTPTQLGCTNKHSTTEIWSTGINTDTVYKISYQYVLLGVHTLSLDMCGVQQCNNFEFVSIYTMRLTVHIHTTQRPKYNTDIFLHTHQSHPNPAGSM
jgi:hypothetical protein